MLGWYILALHCVSNVSGTREFDIKRHLFDSKKYDKTVRPVEDDADGMTLNHSMAITGSTNLKHRFFRKRSYN